MNNLKGRGMGIGSCFWKEASKVEAAVLMCGFDGV